MNLCYMKENEREKNDYINPINNHKITRKIVLFRNIFRNVDG